MSRSSPSPKSKVQGPRSSPFLFSGLLPWALALGGLYWITRPITGGRNWRGFSGVATLRPSIVYRVELVSPLSVDPSGIQALIEEQGGKEFSLAQLSDGMHLYYQQTVQAPVTFELGKAMVGPAYVRSVTRLDGQDWDAP